MLPQNSRNHTTLDFAQGGYLPIVAESFLTDRAATGLSKHTLTFYKQQLKTFLKYCDAQAVTRVQDITPDFIRRFLLTLSEKRNPGGVHVMFRTLRALFRWVELEEVIADWKNPVAKVKAPRVAEDPLEPVSLDDITSLLEVCNERDRAVLLTLLDTGLRAGEFTRLNVDDLDLTTGTILIRKSKSRKPRSVYVSRRTRRAVRAYLRKRSDNCPALFVTEYGDRLTYSGLREIVRRRARDAHMKPPTLHSFRRAFALNFLRNGGDIFSLQRLMGHADLSILKRYLQLTDQDTHAAHLRASPVDRLGGDREP